MVGKPKSIRASAKNLDNVISCILKFGLVVATINFLDRKIIFTYRGKEIALDVNNAIALYPM